MDIDPIPYFYETIDRNAILVRPKKPFFEWMNEIFKEDEPIWDLEENNIYLIREMDNNDDLKKWIKKNFDALFVNELNGWYTDPSAWPAKRTYKMFCEWFDVEVHSMVLDLEDFPIEKE